MYSTSEQSAEHFRTSKALQTDFCFTSVTIQNQVKHFSLFVLRCMEFNFYTMGELTMLMSTWLSDTAASSGVVLSLMLGMAGLLHG